MTRRDRRKERIKDITRDAEGNLVYTGETFRIEENGERVRTGLIVWLVILGALVIGSGCIDAAGANSSVLVIMPFIGEVAALFAFAWNAVKVIYGRDAVRKYILDTAKERIPGALRILTIFAGFGMVMSAVYLIRHGTGGEPFKSLLYPAIKVLTAISSEYYKKMFEGINWVSERQI